ncbi:MAG: hypothetical protein IJ899_14735 [Blautia sp.]|nr:hypothetical protein [Blautia sp.]
MALKKRNDGYVVELNLQELLDSMMLIKNLRDYTRKEEGGEEVTKALQTALEVLICYISNNYRDELLNTVDKLNEVTNGSKT